MAQQKNQNPPRTQIVRQAFSIVCIHWAHPTNIPPMIRLEMWQLKLYWIMIQVILIYGHLRPITTKYSGLSSKTAVIRIISIFRRVCKPLGSCLHWCNGTKEYYCTLRWIKSKWINSSPTRLKTRKQLTILQYLLLNLLFEVEMYIPF